MGRAYRCPSRTSSPGPDAALLSCALRWTLHSQGYHLPLLLLLGLSHKDLVRSMRLPVVGTSSGARAVSVH